MNTHDTHSAQDEYTTQHSSNARGSDSGYIKKVTGYVVGPVKGGPSGEDVGRLMLKDLCWTWEQMNAGDKETPHSRDIFSAEEKSALVSSLRTEEDIRDYNIYREIHTTLVRMPERFSLARTRAELAFWRLHALVLNFHQVEQEHAESYEHPRILTEQQFAELTQRYTRQELGALCPGGIAVLRGPSPHIDTKGCYAPPPFPGSHNYAAEHLLALHSRVIRALFASLESALRECYALLEGMNLIAERVEVPELKRYIQEQPPEEDVSLLNRLMEDVPGQIVRFNRYRLGVDENETQRLREQVRQLLPPVDLDSLKPAAEAVERAQAFLEDITVIYRDTSRLFELLEGGSA